MTDEGRGEGAAERARSAACAVFDVCREAETARGARDAALVSVLYGAGLPVKEVVRLPVEAYDPGSGRLRVAREGERQESLRARSGAREALDEWIALRGTQPGVLFLRLDSAGRPLSRPLEPREVRRALRRWAERAGLEGWNGTFVRRHYRSPWWRPARGRRSSPRRP